METTFDKLNIGDQFRKINTYRDGSTLLSDRYYKTAPDQRGHNMYNTRLTTIGHPGDNVIKL